MSDRPPSDRDRPIEPEIIPPGEPVRMRRSSESWVWIERGERGAEFHVRRPGIGSILLGAAVFGIGAAIVLAILVSAVLIWIPLIGIGIAALLLSGIIRGWSSNRRVG